jgi:hypothetical protein
MMNAIAKTCAGLLSAVVLAHGVLATAAENAVQRGHVGGYTQGPSAAGQPEYNAGFSIYSAAWPLLGEYPGRQFQSGLFGTWMHPPGNPQAPIKLYSDIEGGLGWWRGTPFPTLTPQFHMGGVALNFSAFANGPGSGKGTDWDNPHGQYGVAQLSPWLLFPLAGLNLKQGTCGELFGYGYLPLPLTRAKSTTAGKDVPTGDQCWTLFLSTGNFKGPATFFTPYFWSRPSVEDPRLAGMFLDTRPCSPNRQFSMETQYIPWAQAKDSQGRTYARLAPTRFPLGPDGNSVVLHRITSYSKKALWDGVKAWFEGGDPVDGAIDPKGAYQNEIKARRGMGWKVYLPGVPNEQSIEIATDAFIHPVVTDPASFGFRLDGKLVAVSTNKAGSLVTLPEWYRLLTDDKNGKSKWVAVAPEEVPAETGLGKVSFGSRAEKASPPLATPQDPGSCWKKPGPVAGPFKAKLGDGSTVTYYWYRFADQPALLNADLTAAEREDLQKRVEKLHRHWTREREYLAPPTTGKLADIDPAQIVTPPRGFEAGYVPIATRQAKED